MYISALCPKLYPYVPFVRFPNPELSAFFQKATRHIIKEKRQSVIDTEQKTVSYLELGVCEPDSSLGPEERLGESRLSMILA